MCLGAMRWLSSPAQRCLVYAFLPAVLQGLLSSSPLCKLESRLFLCSAAGLASPCLSRSRSRFRSGCFCLLGIFSRKDPARAGAVVLLVLLRNRKTGKTPPSLSVPTATGHNPLRLPTWELHAAVHFSSSLSAAAQLFHRTSCIYKE